MSAFWLKLVGTSERPWPNKPYHLKSIGFRKRKDGKKPSGIRQGDHLLLYAVGGSKRIFAIAKVTREWYEVSDDKEWPYRVDIQWPLEVNLLPSKGVYIDNVSTDITVTQQSHVRITREEFEKAASMLRVKRDKLREKSKKPPPV